MVEHTPTDPPPPSKGRRRWSILVPVIAALAGLLLTTTARTAAGTNLRDDRRPELTRVIGERKTEVADETRQAAALQAQIDATTAAEAGSDGRIAEQRARADSVRTAAGVTALHGPGLRVVLDDAPRRPGGGLPAGARPDDVVVHQQDVQSVVNALWAGGAEAMAIMGLRVISTSAVRCVGNTLLLQGRTYSPPFVITAIGDAAAIRAQLALSPQVAVFQQAVDDFGLTFSVRERPEVTVPAYDGVPDLQYATAR